MLLIIFLLLFNPKQSFSLEQCSETNEDNKEFCLKVDNYFKYQPPQYPNLTTVHIEVILRDILMIDEEAHFMELVAYSNLKWMEPRIDIKWIGNQIARFTDEEMNPLWKSLTHYTNAHTVSLRLKMWTATIEASKNQVWFKQIIIYKLKFACSMDFSNYPFDSHLCTWRIRNLIENNESVQLVVDFVQEETKNVSGTVQEPLQIMSPNVQFDIEVFALPSDTEYSDGELKSIALIQFKLTRKAQILEQLFTGYFAPMGFFALLSLISYLIKPEIVPGRMGMLTVLFLIITSIHANVDGPSARGFSYIEVWYVGMFMPIVIAIVEYAIILAIIKFKEAKDWKITLGYLEIKMHQCLGYVDILFLFCNLVFYIGFVIWYHAKVISLLAK